MDYPLTLTDSFSGFGLGVFRPDQLMVLPCRKASAS
jgi:hypothetical protein